MAIIRSVSFTLQLATEIHTHKETQCKVFGTAVESRLLHHSPNILTHLKVKFIFSCLTRIKLVTCLLVHTSLRFK